MNAIISTDGLEAAVAEVCRMKLKIAAQKAEMEAEVAAVQKRYAARIAGAIQDTAALETLVYEYCLQHRAQLFAERKSRENTAADYGFEITPPRVETVNRKITWREVVKRIMRLPWAVDYVTHPDPMPNKQALIADRAKLSPEQCQQIGIQFAQDEQFFIRPKSEVAEDTSVSTRAQKEAA